jgi:predicted Zn-dependent peptidase
MLINYETPSKIAEFVADQYITLGKIVFPEERAQEFSKVTMEDIERILPLLKRENRYTFYIK